MFPMDIQTPLIAAACGALAGFAVNISAERYRLWQLNRNMNLEVQPRVGSRVTARIYNGYIFPLSCVYAYITVNHEQSDVLEPPPPAKAYVRPNHLCQVIEDRLCWSVEKNPASVDIYAKERQALDVANIDPHREWVEIPSESGWGSVGQTSRVFLKFKKYRATIKIVSKDTEAKEFQVLIDPDNS
jgi:hypothetical protein